MAQQEVHQGASVAIDAKNVALYELQNKERGISSARYNSKAN